MFFQSHERQFFCAFLAETLYVLDKSSTTSKCIFSDLLLLTLKFTKFLMSFLEPRISFSLKLCITLQCQEITRLYFFSWHFISFWQKESIKVQISRLSTARMKINQIPYVVFQAASQLFCKILHHPSVSWHIITLKSSTWSTICFWQKEPINVQFLRLWAL